MTNDVVAVDAPVLSPRASIALLTLQLRATMQEADAAERAAQSDDVGDVLVELRAKVAPLIDERRRSLDAELDEVRAEAAAAVVAAHAEASSIVAAASASAAAVNALAQLPEQPPEQPPYDWVHAEIEPLRVDDQVHADEVLADPASPIDVQVDEVVISEVSPWAPPSTLGGLASGALVVPFGPNPNTSGAVTVVLDAESFARAFAVAMAPLLEGRIQAPGTAYPPTQVIRVVEPARPAKKSFWANAWHLDVVLSGIAMVIVLAVLVAWTN